MPAHMIAIALTWSLAVPAPTPAAPTADSLAAKNVEAKGGLERLRAVKSVRTTGKLLINNGQFEMAVVQTVARPASVRVDATVQGLTATQAYDGKDAWQINPFQGRKDPERMAPDDAKALIEETEIGGPLVDWQTRGHTLAYLGTEDVDGTEAHKIKVTRKNGDVQYVFLDPDYFIEIRVENRRTVRGVQEETVTDLGNYEKVDGVYVPLSVESGRKGSSDRQKLELAKVELDVAADETLFRFPASAGK